MLSWVGILRAQEATGLFWTTEVEDELIARAFDNRTSRYQCEYTATWGNFRCSQVLKHPPSYT